jgi:integrase/recombinase XerD
MEVINLKLYDLDLDRGAVTIHQSKGRKDRVVPIGERAVA